MAITLAGTWRLRLDKESRGELLGWPTQTFGDKQCVEIPGVLQAQGYGDEISTQTPWVSGLHDTLWYVREDYKFAQEKGCKVPFLAQPPRHFVGKAWYQRTVEIPVAGSYTVLLQLTHWRTTAWLDGVKVGGDCSLCVPHEIALGHIAAGNHTLTLCIDTAMQYPYRPDGHGVSDALGATWNGIAGQALLLCAQEVAQRSQEKAAYAAAHPRHMEVRGDMFFAEGKPLYLRGTHFGGEYPLTGYPETNGAFWSKIMTTLKAWGLNFLRCHSCCLPEEAFCAADEAGIFIQVECGMWNVFEPQSAMLEVLQEETQRILRSFGHHPSFALLSPTNEPDGQWYQPLRQWVAQTRAYDASLGYEGRRIYTAQSGWYYDVPPAEIEGTDYIYFHRSAHGPILGGNIRNHEGWKGKDYAPSLEGAKLPVICHELGQWCAYPDFEVMEKFTGYLRPHNYEVFRENAKGAGLYALHKEFAKQSGKWQARLYKEELEANFRTPHLYGFELLDLHDYLGQGTALVGVLDAFWDSKGAVTPQEWGQFCAETVLLARFSSYVWKQDDIAQVPIEVCHFGAEPLRNVSFVWRLCSEGVTFATQTQTIAYVPQGKGFSLGTLALDFSRLGVRGAAQLVLTLGEVKNTWDLQIYAPPAPAPANVLYTKSWSTAKEALQRGERVVFSPHLSTLDYHCPPLSVRSVFWNAQMGPNWARPLGLLVQDTHPVFREFSTQAYGGWQWEDILAHARGFCLEGLPQELPVIVRPIDDWNRNLSQALLFECKLFAGSLLFVSADLEGGFSKRPAATALKAALLAYGASSAFCPSAALEPEAVEAHFQPNQIMEALGATVCGIGQTKLENAQALLDGNPNTIARATAPQWPVSVEMQWQEAQAVEGLVYMADQKDRLHEGDVKQYRLWAKRQGAWETVAQGQLKSTSLPQDIRLPQPVQATALRFEAMSGFQPTEKAAWEGAQDGWHCVTKAMLPQFAASILQPLVQMAVPEHDIIYWDKSVKSSTKEIDD